MDSANVMKAQLSLLPTQAAPVVVISVVVDVNLSRLSSLDVREEAMPAQEIDAESER